jgi:hypothetical protein
LRRPKRSGSSAVVNCRETLGDKRGRKVLAVQEEAANEATALVGVVDGEFDVALQQAASGERGRFLTVRV